MSTSSPQKKSFPVFVPDGHRGERGSAPSTPNQHPYAIKTTSTALLTRSNSSGHAAHTQHAYVPTTPSPSSKHRYTKSDITRTAVHSPRPLPMPPSLDTPSKYLNGHNHTSSEDFLFPTHRTKRADTLPSTPALPPPSPVKVDDLPSNPRVWTASQLSSYLITALRVKSGESLPLPLPVTKDIAAFVKEARLNGRAFLRLNEQDFESLGVNNLWREALFNASHNLRQNVLKGRIWGFDGDDGENNASSSPFRRSASNSSSFSIDEMSDSKDTTPIKNSGRKGRVRGLVASLERSSSSGSGFSNNGSSTSEGDVLVGAWADDEAAFASGSEASDVEDRKARATIKKRIVPEPTVPPVETLPEIFGNASPESEPTVEELLTPSSLSHSWGARAWEDIEMNAGETVKRIPPDKENAAMAERVAASQLDAAQNPPEYRSRTSFHARYLRDLCQRPPKSGASSPRPQNPVLGTPAQIIEKLDQSTQADAESSPDAEHVTRVTELAEAEAEKLQQAITLLRLLRVHLAEVEEKLNILERKDAEHAKITHHSKAVETDAEPSLLTESKVIQAENLETELRCTSTLETKSVQTKDANDASTSGFILQPTSANVIDNAKPYSSPSDGGREWREYFSRSEWDPFENGMPSYVLMVGVGVCAAVLSTLLKRLAGKKS
ncbi:hypothetical protein EW145_g5655 [Phellinidium pouzarii]|uniref:SAM domain-containing protein n=1 Tax=Phellinidium pouzarii TaxID=167371 RepID=A0A4S4L146_9AGAM|nr:hypothetical protein EW145_g5655 [Phellinidium pouzarii]